MRDVGRWMIVGDHMAEIGKQLKVESVSHGIAYYTFAAKVFDFDTDVIILTKREQLSTARDRFLHVLCLAEAKLATIRESIARELCHGGSADDFAEYLHVLFGINIALGEREIAEGVEITSATYSHVDHGVELWGRVKTEQMPYPVLLKVYTDELLESLDVEWGD